MKILNPNYAAPADPTATTVKSKLAAWFASHPGVQSVTIDQIVAAAPEAAGLTPGAIHQAARDAGWVVDPNG